MKIEGKIVDMEFKSSKDILRRIGKRISEIENESKDRKDFYLVNCKGGLDFNGTTGISQTLGKKRVSCIIADSFSPTSFRELVNEGIYPVIRLEDTDIDDKEDVVFIPRRGVINSKYNGRSFQVTPLEENILEIIAAGGLLNFK